ncbi:hypothetical protein D3C85_652590 [compost metagenome]
MRDDPPQFLQAIPGLVGDDVVGALIDSNRAALVALGLGTGHRLEQFGDVHRLGVIDLQQFPAQRGQFGDLL